LKITTEPSVNPVVITLETQEEIDQMYALLNFAPVLDIMRDMDQEWYKVYKFLHEVSTEDYHKFFNMLNEGLDRKKKAS